MKRYLIERDIPNVGSLTHAQLKDLAATSNNALAKLSGKVQWVQSFIAADRTFCRALSAGRVPDNEDHRSVHRHRADDRV